MVGWSGEKENEGLGNNECSLMKIHASNPKRTIKIINILALTSGQEVAQLWLSGLGIICKAKGRWFNFWSGHTPGLQVWSPVRTCTRSNQSMFPSNIDVSLSLYPPFPSL